MNTTLQHIALTLLHSVWQSALLFGFALLLMQLYKQAVVRKQILFLSVISQFLVSAGSFLLCKNEQNFLNFSFVSGAKTQWLNLVTVAYAAALLFKSFKLIYRWRQVNQVIQLQEKASIQLRLFTERTAWQMGITTKVKVFYSKYIHTPITIGVFKPLIILPIGLVNHLSMAATEAIILHELAHIQQKDYVCQMVLMVLETLFFFNPFVLGLIKQYKQQRELVADEMVLHFNVSPIVYSETLFAAAKMYQSNNSFALALLGKQKNELLLRIQHINQFQPRLQREKIALPKLLLSLLAVALVFFSFNQQLPTLPPVAATENTIALKKPIVEPTKELAPQTNAIAKIERKVNNAKPSKATKAVALENMPLTKSIESVDGIGFEATPVAIKESNVKSFKDKIFIEQEQSNSKTKKLTVYDVTYENGIYTLIPQVGFTRKDSVVVVKDSLRGVEQ